jgi:hypothetical protein
VCEEEESTVRITAKPIVDKSKKCEHCEGDGKNRKFKCPDCGSSKFGSEMQQGRKLKRICHGPLCWFEFPESDDKKYFHGVDEKCPPCQGSGFHTTYEVDLHEKGEQRDGDKTSERDSAAQEDGKNCGDCEKPKSE